MPNGTKLTITLDTNSIIDFANSADNNVKTIWRLSQEGKIDIVKTDVVDTEIRSIRAKQVSNTMNEDMGYAVVGHSRVDHTRVATESFGDELDEILQILWPSVKNRYQATDNQIRDAMGLHTHRMHNRDIFLTGEKALQNANGKLSGIEILSPSECVKKLKALGTP